MATSSFLKKSLNVVQRVGQTATIAGKTGLRVARGEKMDATLLKQTFEQLGTTYIKIGQFIASTPSLFPRDYVEAFQGCLDQTTPIPYSYIEGVLRAELEADGQTLEDLFISIEEQPLASASIAQVHAAVLNTGDKVVLKVQKPNVDTIIHTDLGLLHGMTKVLETIAPSMQFASIAPIIDEIRLRMMAETDFIQEARNIEDFQRFLTATDNQRVVAPAVYHELSTKKVLVMERLHGVSMIDEVAMRQYCNNPADVMSDVLNTWFASLMFGNSFHADLHAGNLMLLTDGRIGFIDFGIVGELKPEAWQACVGMMDSFAREDYNGMARHMVAMGMTYGQATVNVDTLATDLKSMMQKILAEDSLFIGKTVDRADPSQLKDHADEINKMLLEMVEVGKRHGIHFPRDFALLTKQLLYFDRFMKVLAPQMDMFHDARIHLQG